MLKAIIKMVITLVALVAVGGVAIEVNADMNQEFLTEEQFLQKVDEQSNQKAVKAVSVKKAKKAIKKTIKKGHCFASVGNLKVYKKTKVIEVPFTLGKIAAKNFGPNMDVLAENFPKGWTVNIVEKRNGELLAQGQNFGKDTIIIHDHVDGVIMQFTK